MIKMQQKIYQQFEKHKWNKIMLILFLSFLVVPAWFLFYYINIASSYFKSDSLTVDEISSDNYHDLSPELKTIALDFAWSPNLTYLRELVTVRVSTFLLRANSASMIIFAFFELLILAVEVSDGHNDDIIKIIFLVYLLITFIMLMYFGVMLGNKIMNLEAMQNRRYRNAEKLRDLAVVYINSYCRKWFALVNEYCLDNAKSMVKLESENIFRIFSSSPSFSPSDLPVPKISLAYLLVSKHALSVISGIVMDIKATSYLDEANRLFFVVTPATSWLNDEFHFIDVMEVSYEPKQESESEREIAIDGYLNLTLSNGSKKSYSASKYQEKDLVSTIREKVREARVRENPESASEDEYSSDVLNQKPTYCSNCGEKLGKAIRYCPSCGVQVV